MRTPTSLPDGKRKRHVAGGYLLRSRLAATGRDHDELSTVDLVGRGRRVPRRWECRLPQERPGGLVERAELAVIVRGADKHQAARRDYRTAVVLASSVRQPLGRQLAIVAQRDLPDILTRAQVDGAERAPRRLQGRISIGVEEFRVLDAVFLVDRRGHLHGHLRLRLLALSFALTYSPAVAGSKAAPPHPAPPSKPGNTIVPCRLAGTN